MRSPGRFATLAVASALLVVHGAGVLHLLVAEHERCAEHGELVERHAARALPPAPRPAIGEAALAAAAAAAAHDHEHCLVLLARRTTVAPAAQPFRAPADAAPVDAVLVDRVATQTAAALYRLAPKNSPPA